MYINFTKKVYNFCLIASTDYTCNAPISLHKDYYPELNAIIIGGSVVSTLSEFNYYIPVWIKYQLLPLLLLV